jgi:DNA-binding response OmpR family regulator
MHVLVIEDDPRLSRLLGRLLEGEGHVVRVATDGATGLGIAGGANHLDCIILDIGLPDMSGLEVAKRLRSVGSEVGILILSARDPIVTGWPASLPVPTITWSSRSLSTS